MTGFVGGNHYPRTWDAASLALRIGLGLMFLVPAQVDRFRDHSWLGDTRDQLVAGFTDPVKGFMAPWSVQSSPIMV